ncbi:class I adenylate-forming enzyme family protein [Bacillus dakarensis]|uniref:class I adenylate-forming enzyme family protein n=1 Tax=Robertmurraya dakarensis TaxID=1926278 RepID=UPI0009822FF4|nr:class I adenylate-forming enzyme family protein [Bacillus dakarensis]
MSEEIRFDLKTIPQVLKEAFENWPDRVAIKYKDQEITYREQYHKICCLAKGLRNLGIKKGDHIATLMGGYPEWFYISHAINMIGAVIVPINVTFKYRELIYVLRHANVKALITMDHFRGVNYMELIKEVIPEIENSEPGYINAENCPDLSTIISFSPKGNEYPGCYNLKDIMKSGINYSKREIDQYINSVTPEDTSHILFTSGSTAFPKPVLRSHGSNMGIAYFLYKNNYGITTEDTILGAATFYHVGGCVYLTLGSITVGSRIALMEYFEPEGALRLIETEKVTSMGGFDTHLKMLSSHPRFKETDISSIKKITLACGPEWYDRIRELGFQPDLLSHHYGFTEGTGVVMPALETNEQIRKYSNGKPFPGVHLKIVDPVTGSKLSPNEPGEICLKGWPLFQGYYKMPKETSNSLDDEGFFHTGDYGWLDEQGYLYYRGRYKQMIKTGGENVSEREVEMLLEGHPSIKSVQVVGVPDENWGEAVTAIVELQDGKELSIEEIKNYFKGNVASFKIPKFLVELESHEWPVNPTGKYDKKQLREMAITKLKINVT